MIEQALRAEPARRSEATDERPVVRGALIVVALLFVAVFLVLPLLVVFGQAFAKGVVFYARAIEEPDSLAAIRLTLVTAFAAVSLNLVFGVLAAWTIAKFRFFGRSVLVTVIDLPFAISPVVSGLVFVLLFGAQGWLGGWLSAHDIRIVFAPPGIVLATVFVTFPFVARELIPVMQALGNEEEEAAIVLGASGLQTFFRVTLPNVKWGLMYGIVICNARAMGEFGAVSVVSGHVRGLTDTIPLQVEILYNGYSFTAAFAMASLLAFLAIATLVVKSLVEWRLSRESKDGN